MYILQKPILSFFFLIFNIYPLFFLTGVAANNIYSVLLSFFGIYFFFKNGFLNYLKIKYLNFYLFFLVLLITSSLMSDFIGNSIKTSSSYFLYYFYLIASLQILSCFDNKNYKYFLYSIYVSFFIIIIFSVIEYISSLVIFRESYDVINEGSKSIFENKILGTYIVKILPLFFGFKLFLKKKFQYFDYILITILIILIFLSYNRTSIFLLLILLFLLFIFFNEIRIFIFKIFTINLFIILLIFVSVEDIRNKLIIKTKNQLFEDSNFHFYPKQYLGHYQTSINMIKNKFLMGVGPDTFKKVCSDRRYVYFYEKNYDENGKIELVNSCSTHTHNFYLQLFSESGIFSFLCLLLFYFYSLKELFLIFLKKHQFYFNKIYIACLISVILFFLPFSPSHDFFNTYMNSILYLPIIFILFINMNNNDKLLFLSKKIK